MRVTAAEYQRQPGGVFDRLADGDPLPARVFYEYRSLPTSPRDRLSFVVELYIRHGIGAATARRLLNMEGAR